MSVVVTMHMTADSDKLEAWSKANEGAMLGIVESAKRHGLIAHRFYSDGNGNIMVLDEWPDAASFQAFFEATHDEIVPMMAAAQVQGEPSTSFWQELETPDRHGWGIQAQARR